jgi:uncharacterized protein
VKRTCAENLDAWKVNPGRKPLILLGARQVGKTHLLKHFGASSFSNTVYLNFESDEELNKIFEPNLEPKRILEELKLYGHAITPGETLIIFDEIQYCPRALTSLKYFCEHLPNLHICAAGSLLGLFLSEAAFPVGKVDLVPLQPMTFREFLTAIAADAVLERVQLFATGKAALSEVEHSILFSYFKEYLTCGGLPEVVAGFVSGRVRPAEALLETRKRQSQLIINYIADMAKHSGKVNSMHIERVWLQSARQLAQTENDGAKKFAFKGVVPNIRGYERLTSAIDWLSKAGLSHKISICNSASQPLQAYTKESIFKLYVFDIGILGAMVGLGPETIRNYDFATYKGYLVENLVLQELHAQGLRPFSWQEGTAEIEFLLNYRDLVVPVEVKAGQRTKAKSLSVYCKKYSPKISVKITGSHIPKLQLNGGVLNIPVYASGWLSECLAYGSRPSEQF